MMSQLMSRFKLLSLCVLLLISACSEEAPIDDIDDPELVAVAFFDALYNEKNVKKAATVCSPKMARIILHYHSPQAVARHLFNMSYDQVTIKPDDSGVKVREQFKNNAVVILYFDGTYNDNHIKDVKQLKMIQLNGKWVIDKVMKDPF
jgi:hypothetical protein